MSHARRTAVLVLWACALLLLLAVTAYAAPVPVAPGTAKASQFAPSTGCGCHSARVGAWEQSMHSRALKDPLFAAKVAEGDEATGGKLGPFCRTCHGPIATITGESGEATVSAAAAESITCTFCHQVSGVRHPLGNTSQLVDANGVYRAQLADPQAPHPAGLSAVLTTSEICGGCHDVNHPVNGMHLESTYSEWKKSPYAEKGVNCQDCHMSAMPGGRGPFSGWAAAGGPLRPNIYEMSFSGAQVALGDPILARAMLRSAAKVELVAPEYVKPGESASVTVTITNTGAGHYLPTGLTEVREMWLEISAVAPDGSKTKIGERTFGTVLEDAAGKFPVELWNATAIHSDDRIPPQGSVEASATFTMPSGSSGSVVRAELLYRSAPDELAAKAQVDNPVTLMASAEAPVWASADVRQREEGKAALAQHAGDSIMPLFFAVLGLLASVALIVVFARNGRRTA